MITPLGVGKITNASLANSTGLSAAQMDSGAEGIPDGATWVLLQAESQDVRWKDDGGDPETSEGMLLKAGDPPTIYDGPLSSIKFIRAAAGAILRVAFYKN